MEWLPIIALAVVAVGLPFLALRYAAMKIWPERFRERDNASTPPILTVMAARKFVGQTMRVSGRVSVAEGATLLRAPYSHRECIGYAAWVVPPAKFKDQRALLAQLAQLGSSPFLVEDASETAHVQANAALDLAQTEFRIDDLSAPEEVRASFASLNFPEGADLDDFKFVEMVLAIGATVSVQGRVALERDGDNVGTSYRTHGAKRVHLHSAVVAELTDFDREVLKAFEA